MLNKPRTFLSHNIISDPELVEWRKKALTIILIVLAITGLPAYSSVIFSAIRRGNIVFLEVVYIAIYAVLTALACLPRLNYGLRVWGLIGASYVNAMASFMRLGLVGSGRIWLLICPAVATVIISSRAGYALGLLSICIYIAFAVLSSAGFLGEWVVLRENPFTPGFWIEGGAALLVFICILVILIERFVTLQGKTLADYRVSNEKLTETTRELRESDDRIRAIGDNLPGGMIYQLEARPDGTRHFTYISAGVERLHGYTQAQVLADPLLLYNRVYDDDIKMMRKREDESFREMRQFDFEVRFRDPSGGVRWSRIISQPRAAGEGVILCDGIELDVTRSKVAEEALRNSEARYRWLNAELEGKVAARTEELKKANDDLKRANDDLVNALDELTAMQFQLVQAEKLAALGQLAAGIAHELNTPLGAIGSSVRSIIDAIQRRIPEGAGLFASLNEKERRVFQDFLAESMENAPRIDSLPDRKEVRELEGLLAAAGVRESASLAKRIADMGAHGLKEKLPGMLGVGRSGEIIEAVSMLSSIRRLGEVISVASEKASNVVGALQTYMKKDADVDLENVSIEKEIDTLLTLYYNKTKHGVTIKKNYMTDIPAIGNRDRLNQVWMNLLNNAFQAIEWRGTVEIVTEKIDGRIAVSIIDSGPGIPESIQGRIFEPFFTTKKHGEGMGLGLDICRKIVESHGGSIEFQSGPGRTVFTVKLNASVA